MNRAFLLIVDGMGIGAQDDAAEYGDVNANTLGNVSKITNMELPNFAKLGLGNIEALASIPPAESPFASYGKMREVSAGKDSTTGHWELAGIHLNEPFPTYPNGFPDDVIQEFCRGTNQSGILCNAPYSGTQVIDDYGEEHIKTGKPIVYTSADSVFQIACHTDVVPLQTLYDWCEFSRHHLMTGKHGVGRVIARPFEGEPGAFMRISEKRKDFSRIPPKPNLLSVLLDNDIKTYSIGKVSDLFANTGFTQYRKTKSNEEGISQLLSLMSAGIGNSFTFVNLIDTDQIYGHRQDPVGFAHCLEEIDRALPAILDKLGSNDLLLITGDHGNDPTDDSTDHTREFVPILAVKKDAAPGTDLGVRSAFSDAAATVLNYFEVTHSLKGTSFLEQMGR